jgi:hypothetical protein
MEIKPLYFDAGTKQITEAKSGDTLGLPITSVVIDYVTLFQNTDINTCCALVDCTAIPVSSNNLPVLTYRKVPYVDCVTLEAGLSGQTVRAALIHGKNYSTNSQIIPSTIDTLYLGQDGKLTFVRPSLINGDRWLVVVGRMVNYNEFIFDPQTPIDLEDGDGNSGNLPPITGSPNTWLFNDGSKTLWKKLSVSDLAPAFAINSFTSSVQNAELGQSISNIIFSASYNSSLSSARLKDSVLNSWIPLAPPYNSFTSPGTYTNYNQTSVTFTLEAHDLDNNVKTASLSISWLPRKFWGTGIIGTSITQLQNSILSNNLIQTFTVTANPNEYIFLAIPSSFGIPTFYVGGFEGGFQLISSNLQITNTYGVTIGYDLWRSDNSGLGVVTVSIV